MWQAIALSFGLAMDATAVSAARGLGGKRSRDLIGLPLLFGGFQAGMAALGWFAGSWVGPYIARWQNWVAFGLLLAIGGKMIYEAVRGVPGEDKPPGLGTDLLLALATSIDAAAAGLTLPQLRVAPGLAVVMIGTITAACCATGYVAGRALGDRFGSKLEVLGGVVLIGIGVEMLVTGL